MSRRVALAGLFHESNTFVDTPTTLADFDLRRGEEITARLEGTQTVLGGFFAAAFEHVPILYGYAVPAGMVTRDAYDSLVNELCAGLAAAGRLDGVLIELHGAMVVDGLGAADGRTAQRIRAAIGETPLAIVLDPHTNLAEGLVEAADLVLAYQTNPHEDMARAGARAAELLGELMDGEFHPRMHVARIPVTAPAIAQATADEPLREIMAAARSLEQDGCAAASVLVGFAYADIPEQSMAVIALTDDDAAAADAVATAIAERVWELRAGFARDLASPREAVAIAARGPGLTVLANVGDNVGGGAAGDSTEIAAELLAAGLPAATTICDPAAVGACEVAGAGASVALAVGTPRLAIAGEVLRVGEGRYINDGPLSRGVEFDMGRIAVVAAGALLVVLQSRAVMANDQNMLRSCGIDLDALAAVDLKGAAAVRSGWASKARRFVDVDSAGPTGADLRRFRFDRVRRPLWPLDR